MRNKLHTNTTNRLDMYISSVFFFNFMNLHMGRLSISQMEWFVPVDGPHATWC